MGHHSHLDTKAFDKEQAAIEKQMEEQEAELKRMRVSEVAKNRQAQEKTLRNVRSAASGSGGFSQQETGSLG